MKPLTLAAAISIVMLALPVAAHAQGGGRGLDTQKKEIVVNPEKTKAEEKAYNDALKRVPAKEFDPWQNVREKAPDEKPSASKKKPPQKKPERQP